MFDSSYPTRQHMYVLTKEGKAIVESTVIGMKGANGNPRDGYLPIVNHASIKDIVHQGTAAVTASNLLYGGHAGDGSYYAGKVKAAQQATLDKYNLSQALTKAVAVKQSSAQLAQGTGFEVQPADHDLKTPSALGAAAAGARLSSAR